MVSRETDPPDVGGPALPEWLEPHRSVLTLYVHLLATDAVQRGLIGPREVPRLWDRHVLNCAVVADPVAGLVPPGARCADVGSGAGLPGLVWACVRPDLQVVLIEPLLRRSTFLSEAIDVLGLGEHASVVRVRAEDLPPADAGFDVVTARAVAPLSRLIGWTVPLLRDGGRLVALKGRSAGEEITQAHAEIAANGLRDVRVVEAGAGVMEPPAVLIVGERGTA